MDGLQRIFQRSQGYNSLCNILGICIEDMYLAFNVPIEDALECVITRKIMKYLAPQNLSEFGTPKQVPRAMLNHLSINSKFISLHLVDTSQIDPFGPTSSTGYASYDLLSKHAMTKSNTKKFPPSVKNPIVADVGLQHKTRVEIDQILEGIKERDIENKYPNDVLKELEEFTLMSHEGYVMQRGKS
ncbi:hypothetical protein L2E82_43766 [Cichorium intybus]|uniref:Uncharacterized protein n=1 Tax=Cichorium intybus TaxID=13427 RepID=A0ACB8ZQ53_CICIN|nr:hypothetical protein L2E82_43766 [Cichorium intybus]